MFEIVYSEDVLDDLKSIKASERRRILDKIEEQLAHQPELKTRNKKIVVGLKPPWEHEDPTWELRIGSWRVFYDVDNERVRVSVRALRRKQPHRTTEESL